MQESSYLENNTRVINLLRSIDKFSTFSDADLQEFIKLGKLKKYEPGETIIQEGDSDSWVYFLLNGSAEISKKGKPIKLLQQMGDIFGEMGVLDGQKRSASIRATESTLLLGVDASQLDQPNQGNNLALLYTLYRMFAEILAERLRVTTEENAKLHAQLAR